MGGQENRSGRDGLAIIGSPSIGQIRQDGPDKGGVVTARAGEAQRAELIGPAALGDTHILCSEPSSGAVSGRQGTFVGDEVGDRSADIEGESIWGPILNTTMEDVIDGVSGSNLSSGQF